MTLVKRYVNLFYIISTIPCLHYCFARKRHRDPNEEPNEFSPISKKLNGLHIDSQNGSPEQQFQVNGSGQLNDSEEERIPQKLQGLEVTRVGGTVSQDNTSHSNGCSTSLLTSTSYQPSLSSQENPVYYEMNKILFEAHIQRLNRSTTYSHHFTQQQEEDDLRRNGRPA